MPPSKTEIDNYCAKPGNNLIDFNTVLPGQHNYYITVTLAFSISLKCRFLRLRALNAAIIIISWFKLMLIGRGYQLQSSGMLVSYYTRARLLSNHLPHGWCSLFHRKMGDTIFSSGQNTTQQLEIPRLHKHFDTNVDKKKINRTMNIYIVSLSRLANSYALLVAFPCGILRWRDRLPPANMLAERHSTATSFHS